jgi:SAM-dependent methyltransferase
VGVAGSAEAIPFDDGVADAVVAGSSLHWFELELALPEIHRVLREDGRFAFGWNHRDDRHPAIARMGKAVYAAQARRPGPRWRNRDWAAELTAGGLFRDVEHALFEHIHELPREALRDHLMSYSGVAALPEDERRPVFSEVAALLDSDESVSGEGRLRLPFVVSAYRVTRV